VKVDFDAPITDVRSRMARFIASSNCPMVDDLTTIFTESVNCNETTVQKNGRRVGPGRPAWRLK